MLQDAAALQSLHFNNSLLPPWLQDGLVNSVSALYKTGMWLADARYRQFESFSCPQVNKSLLLPRSSAFIRQTTSVGWLSAFPAWPGGEPTYTKAEDSGGSSSLTHSRALGAHAASRPTGATIVTVSLIIADTNQTRNADHATP